MPCEQWPILIKDVHPGYISWEEFAENQKRLKHNQQARAIERQSGPPREGPALLQGLAICGKCGSRTERLRAKGFLKAGEIAQLIDSKPSLVDYWREQGLLKGIRLNDRNQYLYENPDADVLQQIKRRTRFKLTNHLS